MTISNPSNRVVFSGPGNGFAYNLPVFADTDIYVEILTDENETLTPDLDGAGTYDFAVSGTFDDSEFRYPDGVTVTLNNALPTGFSIIIENRVSPVQETDYVNGGPLNAERLETDLDRVVVMVQAAFNAFFDLVRVSPAAGISLPPLVPDALKFLRWNAAGDAIETVEIESQGSIALPIDIANGGTGATTEEDARDNLAAAGTGDANTFTKTQTWTKGSDVASATALTLGDGNYFDITGTTAIESIATKGVGTVVKLHFDGALTLTHHATDLILPGGADITTAAGDEAELIEYATGDWRLTSYSHARGIGYDNSTSGLTATYVGAAIDETVQGGTTTTGTEQATTSGTDIAFTDIPSWVKEITVMFAGVSTDTATAIQVQIGDSGGVETSGYLGACALIIAGGGTQVTQNSSGFAIRTDAVAAVLHGAVTLRLQDPANNVWVASGVLSKSDQAHTITVSGSKALSAALDRVNISVASGDFDAGAVNIQYR